MWNLVIEFTNGGGILLRSDRETVLAWVEEVQQTSTWAALRVFDQNGALQCAKGVLLV